MTQTGQTPRHFLHTSFENVNAAPEDDIHNSSATIPDTAEHMGINISAVIQVGHQLAIIGDEYNRTYNGKREDSLFHLAKGIATNVFQTCFWSSFKSVKKMFGSFLNSGWRRKIIDYGWVIWIPLKYGCQKWLPATVLAILMWWLVIRGLQN